MQVDPFRPPAPHRKLWITLLSTVTVFIVGVVLLILGLYMYNQDARTVPYMWSLTLCKVNNSERWIGMELTPDQQCPPSLGLKDGTPQSFHIPKGVLSDSVPYDPVIYITNKETKFAYCGGMELVIFRDGPLEPAEGDYVTTDCENTATGCIYEPGRSLNKYAFDNVQGLELIKTPPDGSYLIVDNIVSRKRILEADSPRSPIIIPDAYIHYEVAGISDSQRINNTKFKPTQKSDRYFHGFLAREIMAAFL